MKNRRLLPLIIYLIGMALILSWGLNLFGGLGDGVTYSELVELFENEQVKRFSVHDQSIELELHEPLDGKTEITTKLADPEGFQAELGELFRQQRQSGVLESYDFYPEDVITPYDFVLPLLLVGLVLLFVWAIILGRANNSNPMNNFGRARTVLGLPDGKKVTFEDVAGADEEKQVQVFHQRSSHITGIGHDQRVTVYFLLVPLARHAPRRPFGHEDHHGKQHR